MRNQISEPIVKAYSAGVIDRVSKKINNNNNLEQYNKIYYQDNDGEDTQQWNNTNINININKNKEGLCSKINYIGVVT